MIKAYKFVKTDSLIQKLNLIWDCQELGLEAESVQGGVFVYLMAK